MAVKVSVIIPVYNKESTLKRCLDSVLRQTYKNLEVICVNDGSLDNSLSILNNYAKKDERVHVIDQENSRAGVARNNGIRHATGDYVYFIDADDFIENDLLEDFAARAEEFDADVVLSPIDSFNSRTGEFFPRPWSLLVDLIKDQPFSSFTQPLEIFRITSPGPANKMFKRSFIAKYGLEFAKLPRSEDVAFTIPALGLADRIVTTESVKPKYHYRIGQTNSLESSKKIDDFPFWRSYQSAKKQLEQFGRFKRVEISFFNAALSSSLYELDTQKNKENFTITWNTLRERIFPDLGISSLKEKDAVNTWDYQRMKEIMNRPKVVDNSTKLTLVIPVYNAEKYLKKCLDSVVNQTIFGFMQVICVDDGSTDHSLSILEQYRNQYKNISVFHQQNLFAGVARNRGIEEAKGEYIAFLDSDDFYCDNDILQKLYRKAHDQYLDMLKCGFYYYDDGTKGVTEDTYCNNGGLPAEQRGKVISFKDNPQMLIHVADVPWNAVYRTAFLAENKIRYNSLRVSNDHSFYIHCLLLAKRMMVVNDKILYYRVNNGESLIGKKAKHFDCQFKSYNLVRELALNYAGDSSSIVLRSDLNSVFFWFNRLVRESIYPISILKMLKEFVQTYDENDVGEDYLSHFAYSKMYQTLRTDGSKAVEETPAISVIIPFAADINSDIVTRCLNNVSNQLFENIEIICAYSQENAQLAEKLKEFKAVDQRIELLPLPADTLLNENLNSTYLECLKSARGKYVVFYNAYAQMDSMALIKLYDNNEVDIAVGDITFEDKRLSWMSGFGRKKSLLFVWANNKSERDIETLFQFGNPLPFQLLVRKEWLEKHSEDINNNFNFSLILLAMADKVSFVDGNIYSLSIDGCDYIHDVLANRYKSIVEPYIISINILKKNHKWAKLEKGFVNYYVSFFANYLRQIEDREAYFYVVKSILNTSLLEYWPETYRNINDYKWLKGQACAYEWYEKSREIKRKAPGFVCGNRVESPKISVVIPVYNVEQYLPACIESIIYQSFKDIEIICINDGSTDSSLSILRDFAAWDDRISVYTQENAGQSVARNAGIKLSRGKYIYFFDADDILREDSLELLWNRLTEDDLDVLYFNTSVFSDDGPSVKKTIEAYNRYYNRVHGYMGIFKGDYLFYKMHVNNEYLASPVLQILKADFLKGNELYFKEGIIHEDELFTFKVMLTAKRAGYINQSFYRRRIRANSTVTSKKSFKNVFGYFIDCQEMQSIINDISLPDCVYKAADETRANLYRLAYQYYRNLTDEEKLSYLGLPVDTQIRFKTDFMDYFRRIEQEGSKAEQKYRDKVLAANKEVLRLKNENNRLVDENKKILRERDSITGERNFWHQELNNVKSGYSFRIGRVITFIPRKIRGGRRCLRDHGWSYTFRRTLWHLGLIHKWHE